MLTFGGVHVSLLYVLTDFCIVSHFHSITRSSTHTTAEEFSYNQYFIHHICNYCNFNHPSLLQQEPPYKDVKAHIYISFRACLEECHWTPPRSQLRFCLTPALLWHYFYVLFSSFTTVSAARCLSAVSLERSLLWKTSNLMANCNKSKLALTLPLGSIRLRPCYFVKRDV